MFDFFLFYYKYNSQTKLINGELVDIYRYETY